MTIGTLILTPVRSRLAATSSRLSYSLWFPLTVFAAARLVDAILMLVAARHQVAIPAGLPAGMEDYFIWEPSPASPGYGAVASNWDGQWYQSIASQGYPASVPHDAAGHVLQNQWGFYPVYPLLVGAVMRLSGLGFTVVAPVLSCLLGAAAVTVMFRLLSQTLGRFAASATVVLVCTYMAAPVMQIAYTESLALLLLCSALLLLRERRYGWFVPVLVTLALTRAVALAFVPVVIAHGISRFRGRSVQAFPVPDRWRVLALAGLAVGATGLWPVIAAIRTGDPMAYTQTMSSWGGTSGKLRVLLEFPTVAWTRGGTVGVALLICILGLAATLVLRTGAQVWGPEIRAWAGFYPLYLLLATAPGSSNVRHLFLAFPLMWPFPEESTSRRERIQRAAMVTLMAIFGLGMQWVWTSQYLIVGSQTSPPFP